MLGDHFPVWALTLILGIVLASVVFFTSKNDVQPKYHAVSIIFNQMMVLTEDLTWLLFIPPAFMPRGI